LQIAGTGIVTYAVDWQLRELRGAVCKSAPKDGSFRVLDLPRFLVGLMGWAVDNRQPSCSCPVTDGSPARKGEDQTPACYLFLGPERRPPAPLQLRRRLPHPGRRRTPPGPPGHPRRPVYVTAGPWPGIPIRRGTRKNRAADLADGTWPDLAANSSRTTTGIPTPPGWK